MYFFTKLYLKRFKFDFINYIICDNDEYIAHLLIVYICTVDILINILRSAHFTFTVLKVCA